MVNSISRFSRDKYGHAIVRTLLSKLNITLRSATEPIDDTPTGKMLEGFLSTIAQFENDEKSVPTKRGMKEAIQRGTWPFPATLGYTKIRQEDGRSKVIQDPAIAPLIKQAFELFATGRYARAEVLRIATAAGLVSKKGRKLSAQSFHSLLRNPFYAGKLVVGRWEMDCKGAFEPIVSRETFRLVGLICAGKRPAAQPRRKSNPDFPLRHFSPSGDQLTG